MLHMFYNEGILDLNGLTLHGLSVKKDGAIGQFGTGIKHAIATVMRINGKVTLYRGKERHTFHLKEEEFRGQKHHRVVMLSSAGSSSVTETYMPFTSSLGLNWKPWMAFREFYANALDEGGDYYTAPPNMHDGSTMFIIESPHFDEVAREFNKWFFKKPAADPVFASEQHGITVYRKEDVPMNMRGVVYYKGMRVADDHTFTYSLTDEGLQSQITEDRTLTSPYAVGELLMDALAANADPDTFVEVASRTSHGIEDHGMVSSSVPSRFYDAVVDYVESLDGSPRGVMSETYNMVMRMRGVDQREPTEDEQRVIDAALTHVKRMGIDPTIYQIKVMDTRYAIVQGAASRKQKTIFITDTAIREGVRNVMMTMIEEYIHIHYNAMDFTRTMQEGFLRTIINVYTHTTDTVL